MGMEITVNSLDEMCDLMCNNAVPVSKEYKYCLRCGRKLKSPETRLRGYGKICEKKMKNPVNTRLFEPLRKQKISG